MLKKNSINGISAVVSDNEQFIGALIAQKQNDTTRPHILTVIPILPHASIAVFSMAIQAITTHIEKTRTDVLKLEYTVRVDDLDQIKALTLLDFVNEGVRSFDFLDGEGKLHSTVDMSWFNPNYTMQVPLHMEYSTIDTEHPLYHQERQLRNEVLLRPIGLDDHAWEKFDAEAMHFIASANNQVHGCVLLVPESEKQAKLIQMAVRQGLQKNYGIGRRLVENLKEEARRRGISEVYCDARENVLEFYKKLGFEVESDRQMIVGVGHYRMRCFI